MSQTSVKRRAPSGASEFDHDVQSEMQRMLENDTADAEHDATSLLQRLTRAHQAVLAHRRMAAEAHHNASAAQPVIGANRSPVLLRSTLGDLREALDHLQSQHSAKSIVELAGLPHSLALGLHSEFYSNQAALSWQHETCSLRVRFGSVNFNAVFLSQQTVRMASPPGRQTSNIHCIIV